MKNIQEINAEFEKYVIVNVCADQYVEVDKVFGPQCSSAIRVRHDFQSCDWVVEEQNFNNGEWVERARFYAQEFYDEKYQAQSEAGEGEV